MVLGPIHDRIILLLFLRRVITLADCATLSATLPGSPSAQDIFDRALLLRGRRDAAQAALKPGELDPIDVNAALILTSMQREDRRLGAEQEEGQGETGADLARGGVPLAVLMAAQEELGEEEEEE
ncbi:hypothetical protein LTR78_006456 [Recurvomyces mirabilis]|uniref:Uncharacterized protein n=1 Tax=Recurvomyces mirabilis TaxID=574656 RepID=A0AAE1BZV5_9PEZI|nr:hypothetical protein LTR78_006456 [Recurvomyces mirabilis]KAK5151124.1 hypothetical protein LTS14_009620 [Recurvomyces mirabilis]